LVSAFFRHHGSADFGPAGAQGIARHESVEAVLIGTVPTAYALNHALTTQDSVDFIATSQQAANVLDKYVNSTAVVGDPREDVKEYVRTKEFTPDAMLALRNTVNDVGTETANFRELGKVPEDQVRNFRNDMYLTSEALRLLKKSGVANISAPDWAVLDNYKKHIDKATKFIPTWVKVAVALALGLGTMVGWKRIVVTVGEKIGKDHLTYG
jgi:inorganic phosphate transporter, PiT family